MDVIPFVKFLGAVTFAGAMIYIFFPVMDMLIPYFPAMTTGNAWLIIFALWNGMPITVLVKETIQLLMSQQRRTLG